MPKPTEAEVIYLEDRRKRIQKEEKKSKKAFYTLLLGSLFLLATFIILGLIF